MGPISRACIAIARHYLDSAPPGVRMAGHLRAMLAATDDAPAKGPWTQHTLRMTMSGNPNPNPNPYPYPIPNTSSNPNPNPEPNQGPLQADRVDPHQRQLQCRPSHPGEGSAREATACARR